MRWRCGKAGREGGIEREVSQRDEMKESEALKSLKRSLLRFSTEKERKTRGHQRERASGDNMVRGRERREVIRKRERIETDGTGDAAPVN